MSLRALATSTVSRPRIAAAGLTCCAPSRCRLKVFHCTHSPGLLPGPGRTAARGRGPPNAARPRPAPPRRRVALPPGLAVLLQSAVFCPTHSQSLEAGPEAHFSEEGACPQQRRLAGTASCGVMPFYTFFNAARKQWSAATFCHWQAGILRLGAPRCRVSLGSGGLFKGLAFLPSAVVFCAQQQQQQQQQQQPDATQPLPPPCCRPASALPPPLLPRARAVVTAALATRQPGSTVGVGLICVIVAVPPDLTHTHALRFENISIQKEMRKDAVWAAVALPHCGPSD